MVRKHLQNKFIFNKTFLKKDHLDGTLKYYGISGFLPKKCLNYVSIIFGYDNRRNNFTSLKNIPW